MKKPMSFFDIDILPGETSRAILKELEKFCADVMRPAGIELDKCLTPADVFAKGSSLWEVFASFRKLDLHLADIPEELGGIGKLDKVTAALVAERLGYADAGLAIGLAAGSAPFCLAAKFKTPGMQALARQFCEDREGRLIGCRAIFRWPSRPEAGAGAMLSAREEGADFLLSGEISGIANAAIATHGAFDVSIDSQGSSETRGLAIIPLDNQGIVRETPAMGSSQRSMPRATLRFAEARVPGEYVIRQNGAQLSEISKAFLIDLNSCLAGVYAGQAGAALDEALEYAKKRVQGGVPIFEHRNVRLQLFNMFKTVEAARASVLRLAAYHDRQGAARLWPHAVAARCLAVEAACRVTSEAIQIFGGYGLAREFPLEKFFRDARLGVVEDGIDDDLATEAMLEV